jgi:hypothetical protein
VFAGGHPGLGAALVANAALSLWRTQRLLRRRRVAGWRRPSAAATLELIWLPVLAGAVVGATVGGAVHGPAGRRLAIGAVVGAWVALCLNFAYASAESWTRRR